MHSTRILLAQYGGAAVLTALLGGCTVVCPVPPASAQVVMAPPLPAPALAVSSADGPRPASPPRAHMDPNAARHLYRLDFNITGTSLGTGGALAGAYTMNLEENRNGEIHSGMNVPITPGGNARMDVGVKIKATYAIAGDELLLDTDTELSSVDEPSGVHKLTARSEAALVPGKPATMLASIDDPQGKKRYLLTVAATKIR